MSRLGRRPDIPRHRNHCRQRRQYRQLAGNQSPEYADKDSRIVVIDKSNEGLAYARKSGIEAAQGEYIQHLDGDDFLEPDAIELLYNKAIEDAADMVVFPILVRLCR